MMIWHYVSIHTPIQGVTINELLNDDLALCFNPHTHTGCDMNLASLWAKKNGFNPHTHTGCDHYFLFVASLLHQFQSTHPYRV